MYGGRSPYDLKDVQYWTKTVNGDQYDIRYSGQFNDDNTYAWNKVSESITVTNDNTTTMYFHDFATDTYTDSTGNTITADEFSALLAKRESDPTPSPEPSPTPTPEPTSIPSPDPSPTSEPEDSPVSEPTSTPAPVTIIEFSNDFNADPDPSISSGIETEEGATRYRNTDGTYAVDTWKEVNGVWYYFGSNTQAVTNTWVGDYYLQKDGTMATNKWIGRYHVGPDGKWDATRAATTKPGWRKDDKGWWYENRDYSYTTSGWQKIGRKWYYFDSDGYMVSNVVIDGYQIGADGAWIP